MRTLTSLILLLVMLAIATGVPQAVHEQEHQPGCSHGSTIASTETLAQGQLSDRPEPCVLCVMMRSPTMAGSESAWLMDTGEWVPFVSMLAVSQSSQAFPARLSCRGPPV